jgi:nucleoside-diphosphate-sugar epimerase
MANILIIGCGDIGTRCARLLLPKHRIFALARSVATADRLRTAGIIPIPGDLDQSASLQRLAGIADAVLHFAPPSPTGRYDLRTRKLLSALGKRAILPRRLVYISTSGVYGDCGGAVIDETRTPQPQSARGMRRLDAETQVRSWGRRLGIATPIIRVPGIYALNRLPLERLRQSTPVLCAADDVYTNHIHADDLALIAVQALRYGLAGRIYHASDDSTLKMGDYFDRVASAFDLPLPPRISRAEAEASLPATRLSFMRESRRMSNLRIKRELQVRLQYPDVDATLNAKPPAD